MTEHDPSLGRSATLNALLGQRKVRVGDVADAPAIRYALTGDGLNIAYLVEGDGPVNLIELSNGTLFSIDATPEQARWQSYVDRLSSFARLVRFDPRGIGLSDPVGSSGPPSAEQWAGDAMAVQDAEDMHEAAVMGVGFGGLAALLLAASRPDRVRALILVNSYACLIRSDDYPMGVPFDLWRGFGEALVEPGQSTADDLPLMAPGLASDPNFSSWWRRAGHRGASPATARALWRASAIDLRTILSTVRVPTLVVHAADDLLVQSGHGRYLAAHIPGARYVELKTADHVPWTSDADFAGEFEEFLTGERQLAPTDRFLATVLFTDIVNSTELATALGDQAWRERLELHDRAVDRQLARFGGHLVKWTGDGVLATFVGPARAVHCAAAIRDAVGQVGLVIRAGLHAGEIEQRGDDIAGIAVHLAQRVQGVAQPGEVLASRTVVDLVVGSGLRFEGRGEHQLKGIPGDWQLFAVLD